MSTKLPPETVNKLARGEKRARALAAHRAALLKAGVKPKDHLVPINSQLDMFGAEVLDPKPLTVPMHLEPLGQRIERLTRLGQARIDGAFDFDDAVDANGRPVDPDKYDSMGDDIGDDDASFVTRYEVAGGDFDHIVKKPSKKPADKPKPTSATPLAGDPEKAPTATPEGTPQPAKPAK